MDYPKDNDNNIIYNNNIINYETYKKNNNNNIKVTVISKSPSTYKISRESNINLETKSNYNTNYQKHNEINREINLDYSDKKSKDIPKKHSFKEKNETNFTLFKSKSPENNNISRKKKKDINNYSNKEEKGKKTEIKKLPKNKKPLEKNPKKEKSKPKYQIQIDLKDLIKENNQEKSLTNQNGGYADIARKKKNKNKAYENSYNKPFRFNMNDDY